MASFVYNGFWEKNNLEVMLKEVIKTKEIVLNQGNKYMDVKKEPLFSNTRQ